MNRPHSTLGFLTPREFAQKEKNIRSFAHLPDAAGSGHQFRCINRLDGINNYNGRSNDFDLLQNFLQ